MPNAAITDHTFPSAEREREIIESAGFEFAEIQPICRTEDDIINNCGGADALTVQWAPVTCRVLEALPSVKCIVRYGVGVNNFGLEVARDLGVDLDTLIRSSEVISLHCSLVPDTQHLINRDTLATMKKGVIVINASRGPVVDEAALVEALQDGTLSGAGLDVFEEEPLPAGSPLRNLSNIIFTSHAASLSEESPQMLQKRRPRPRGVFCRRSDRQAHTCRKEELNEIHTVCH